MINLRTKIYLSVAYIVSLICFVVSYRLHSGGTFVYTTNFSLYDILFFIFLSMFLEHFLVKYDKVAVSPGFAVTVASILYFGPFLAMIINSAAVAFRYVRYEGRSIHILNTPFYKTLFNVSTLSISVFSSAVPYYIYMNSIKSNYIYDMSIGFSILVIMFLIVNTLMLSLLVSILSGSKFLKTYAGYISFGFLDIVFVSPFGIILDYLYRNRGITGAVILIVPFIMLRYLFKLYAD